eukprot:9866970-Karenia_brevis.AAC.1
MVWSAYGGPHADVVSLVRRLARQGARLPGFQSASPLERETHVRVGLELWKKVTHMVLASWPPATSVV